jgi:hypothetical protein
VVRVAQEAGIPCLLVRSVSDAGDDTDFLSFFQTAALNSAAVVRTILQNLPPLLALAQVRRSPPLAQKTQKRSWAWLRLASVVHLPLQFGHRDLAF